MLSHHRELYRTFFSVSLHPSVVTLSFHNSTMSTCGNCDCADKSQCVKKGNSYGVEVVTVEARTRYTEEVVEVAPAAENDGNCKCGASCSCVDCKCGY